MSENEFNDSVQPDPPPPSAPVPVAKRKWWMRFLGLKRRPGKRISWGLTRWGMFLAVVLFMMCGMAAFGEYSMQPDFCQSCHIMQPYYQAWHQSTHKNVPCVDCHFLPGVGNTMYGKFQASSQVVKYVTGTYGSKPHAEIRDESCMREGCHDKRLLLGKVDWKVQTERQVNVSVRLPDGTTTIVRSPGEVTIHFDHTPHLTLERRGKQLRCVSCHSQLVQGRHIVVTTDTCFLCHFKGLKHGRDDQTVGTCKGCHDAPKQTIVLATGEFKHSDYTDRGVKCENCHSDTVRGDGAVPRQVCWNCHNQPGQIEKFGDTVKLHQAHITDHKVECSGCHVQIEHSLVAGAREEQIAGARFATDSGTCGLCHEQTHNGPREMFQGTGGRGVADMPSPMARARVNCIACHMTKETEALSADVKGQTFVATQDRCDYCHGDKYKGRLTEWKTDVEALLTKAEATLLETKTAAGKAQLGAEDALQVQRAIDDAEFNVRFVKLAHGVHNPIYATNLLNESLKRCAAAQVILKGGGAAP